MATPTKSDIVIPRGIDYTRTITALDGGNAPVTGLVFSSDIRVRWRSPVVASFSFSEVGGGIYTMTLAAADTLKLRPRLRYAYDLVYDRSGSITKVLYGTIEPLPDITQFSE